MNLNLIVHLFYNQTFFSKLTPEIFLKLLENTPASMMDNYLLSNFCDDFFGFALIFLAPTPSSISISSSRSPKDLLKGSIFVENHKCFKLVSMSILFSVSFYSSFWTRSLLCRERPFLIIKFKFGYLLIIFSSMTSFINSSSGYTFYFQSSLGLADLTSFVVIFLNYLYPTTFVD